MSSLYVDYVCTIHVCSLYIHYPGRKSCHSNTAKSFRILYMCRILKDPRLDSTGSYSTADTCRNCAKFGKGFKICTNEAYNIKIKIRLGAFQKFSAFVLMPIWLPQTKAFH